MHNKRLLATLIYIALLGVTPLTARTNVGDEYLIEGQRAEQTQKYETALQLYDYALAEDPRDPAYVAADRRARALACQQRRKDGKKLIESQRLKDAMVQFYSALRIDPQSKETQDEIRKLEQQIRESPEALVLEPPNDPIFHILIPNTSPHIAYENIARAAGITVSFDPDVTDIPAPRSKLGEASGISVEDALNFAASATQTSWKPVARTAIHVARAREQNPAPEPFGVRGSDQPGRTAKNPTAFTLSALPPGEALPAAAQADRLADVVHLVLAGALVNARNALGMTALLLSAMGDDPEIVRFLLDHGADPNLPGQPVLHVAASRGNAQIVNLLLKAGADPNALDEHSTAPLDLATFGGQEEIARLLLIKGANVNEDHWPNGRSLLHELCTKGPARMIPLLIEFGADPVRPDRFGETPLDLALANKNEDAVEALLKLARQREPLQLAADSAMENAVVRGYTEVARILVERGLDVNGLTRQGSTYLGDASFKQQMSMVRLLLAKGANVQLRGRSGGTALHDAALGGRAAVIDLLLVNGANIDERELDTGATPLMLAASLNQREAVAALLRRGANLQLRDHSGHTALDRARETGSAEAIELLSK